MSDDPSVYLILHRVRGEPAFDVAQRTMYGTEEGWCIPTSGHRAIPYLYWNLDDLRDTSDINRAGHSIRPVDSEALVPPDWPDHYSVNDRPARRIEKKIKALRGEALDLIPDAELEAILALVREEESKLK